MQLKLLYLKVVIVSAVQYSSFVNANNVQQEATSKDGASPDLTHIYPECNGDYRYPCLESTNRKARCYCTGLGNFQCQGFSAEQTQACTQHCYCTGSFIGGGASPF